MTRETLVFTARKPAQKLRKIMLDTTEQAYILTAFKEVVRVMDSPV